MYSETNSVFSFSVFPASHPEWAQIVNARTSGKAKLSQWRSISDAFPGFPFTEMRARKIGAPHTSAQFKRNAQYRGMSEIKCGDPVAVGDARGVIVGHNSSANFDVLFDEDSPRYAGLTLNVHPSEIRRAA